MSAKPIIAVIAKQRSGTTALNLTLSEDPSLHSFGEVFHAVRSAEDHRHFDQLRLQPDANYFNFRTAAFASEPERSVPTKENQQRLFLEFIDLLSGLTAKPRLLIDVKYNSMHHFDPVWHSREEPPALLDLLKQVGAKVVHLVRNNHFERFCSEQLASVRKVWHAGAGEAVADQKITIKPAQAMRVMERSWREVAYVRGLLEKYPARIELSYEDLFDGDRISPEARKALGTVLGSGFDLSKPVPLRKLAAPPADYVQNMEELSEFFSRTRFAPFFRDAAP